MKKNKVDFTNGIIPLTNSEREVLNLITKEYLTVKKVALRRRTSTQAVYKIVKKLKEKGVLSKTNNKVAKIQPSNNTTYISTGSIRLHGQEFNIKLLYKSDKYIKILDRTNILYIDNNTIRLYKDSLEVYSNKDFIAETPQKATADSFNYFNRFFTRIENELSIIILKPRSQNIKLVNSHYAEINNELAKDYVVSGEKLKIYTKEDGKLWFLIDNSFNLEEAETVHPISSKRDIEGVRAFFNDLRDNKPPSLTQLTTAINELARHNLDTAAGLNSIVTLLKNQIKDNDVKQENKYNEYIG